METSNEIDRATIAICDGKPLLGRWSYTLDTTTMTTIRSSAVANCRCAVMELSFNAYFTVAQRNSAPGT